ncbi:MAG TPA: NAD-dependent epimerase/dehydratase family protein [Stellaceae bacterium]|nr:NAD-dependent epimerase/dehydratase family protein [Stellaceae bacterium]
MDASAKRWFITGGCGFIGVNLIRVLRQRGLAAGIRILDDLSAGRVETVGNFVPVEPLRDPRPIADGSVELVEASITGDVARWVEGADIIVHLAANTGVQPSIRAPRMDLETNVIGTFNMLEAARRTGTPRFVFASSGAPTGNVTPPIHEDVPCRPLSPYGASKLAGEGYCSAYFWAYGLRTVSLRFSNVYGPWSTHKGSVVALLIRQAFAGEPWILNGDGAQTRDFIFIDDLVEAIIATAGFDGGGEIFQVATGRETSVRQLAELLACQLEADFGIVPRVAFGPPLQGDMAQNFASIAKARRLLGWAPKWAIEDGIAATVRWFGQHRQQFVEGSS